MISLEQLETKWNNEFGPDLENISKLVQKIGKMLPVQDKEFVGHKIPKTGRKLKSVKTRPIVELEEIPSTTTHEGRPPLHSFNAHTV